MGYSSVQGYNANSVLSSFHIQASAQGYEDFDSTKSDARNSIDFNLASGNSFLTINIKLKRSGSTAMGEGTITNPGRVVELTSANWKAQTSDKKDSATIYPMLTSIDSNANLVVKYSIGTASSSDLDYSVKYEIRGNNCYEIEGSTEESEELAGGRSLSFMRGQQNVEDIVTLYSKSECWNRNDPDLEREFTISIEGRLLQLGDKEAKAQNFIPAKVKVKPVVGAVKDIGGLGDLGELNEIMNLADGVATIGTLPYCINEAGNTGNSKVVSTRGVSDKTAAEKKIVIEFKGSNSFPESLNELAEQVSDYIKGKLRKTPSGCKAYVKTYDNYMGHIEVGQKGFDCNDARVQQGAIQAQPWEKLFCDSVQSGVQNEVKLGGSYTMKTDTT
jgi:hypothetical protein